MISTCPVCGMHTGREWCCRIDLTAGAPWSMNRARIRAVHILAKKQKGLDEETYRLCLAAVGVSSSLALSRDQFNSLMNGLRALPDMHQPAKDKAA